MKTVEIRVPSTMSDEGIKVKKWCVHDNENVAANSPLVEMESGDFYLEMNADYAGKVKIFLKEGSQGKTNDILCTITY